MRVMPLSKRGIQTSRLVLGCMSLGGRWGDPAPIDATLVRETEAAIDAAMEIGISMFDHANIYKMGKAEQVFGQVLKNRPGLREKIVLQSKCGLHERRFNFSKAHILESVDEILQRLSIDYLDVLLLHRPDPLMDPEEVGEAFGRLKAAGKVRYFGVSNMGASQMRFLQKSVPDQLAVNQLEMGLHHLHWLDQGVHVNQSAGVAVNFGEGLMEYCQLERVQLQAWAPLSQGRFTGAPSDNEPSHIRQTIALVRKMAADRGTTAEAIVLAWLMYHPALIQPVIGTSKPERIKACADAERQASLMTREDWYSLYVSARGERLP